MSFIDKKLLKKKLTTVLQKPRMPVFYSCWRLQLNKSFTIKKIIQQMHCRQQS